MTTIWAEDIDRRERDLARREEELAQRERTLEALGRGAARKRVGVVARPVGALRVRELEWWRKQLGCVPVLR